MTRTNVDRAVNRVFVANFQEKSFESARKFGDEIIFVTTGFIPLNDMEAVRQKLAKYVELSNSSDYLILLGPSVINCMLSILWFEKHGFINILSWDSKRNDYNHFVIGTHSVVDGAA
jgi:hypothetical protein